MLVASIGASALKVAEVVVGIGLLIFIHELGHFLAGKLMGVRILKFSLGFGRRLAGFRRGETEYAISLLPLGGYVKFAGENPGEQKTSDPRALVNQKAWRRAIIFAAGVTMNIVGALVMFIVAFGVGVRFTVPRVGRVLGGPAHEAGILPGDEIVELAGRGDLDFSDIRSIVALSDPGRDLPIVVRRGGKLIPLTVRPRLDPELGDRFPTIGIAPPVSTRVAAVAPGSAAEAADIKKGERILAVAVPGRREVKLESLQQLQEEVRRAGPKPFVLEIEGRDGRRRRQTIRIPPRREYRFPWQVGRAVIMSVRRGGPAAEAGLLPGDVILSAGEEGTADVAGLIELIRRQGRTGRPLALTVSRRGRTLTVALRPRPETPGGVPRIGVSLGVKPDGEPVLAWVKPGSAPAEAGLAPGWRVLAVEGRACSTVKEVEEALAPYQGVDPPRAGEPVRVRLRRPDGTEVVREVAAQASERYELGIVGEFASHLRRYRNVLKACVVGWRKTVINVRRVLLTLRRIVFTRTVAPDNVAGPVQIPVMAYKYAELGPGDFLYFLAILGANLAVVNLLPIPILDGGQLLMLAAEKVKGSRLSERAQAAAQYVGLAIILLLFLYILLQDVGKLVGSAH